MNPVDDYYSLPNDTLMGKHAAHAETWDEGLADGPVPQHEAKYDIHVKVDSPSQANPYCIALSSANTWRQILPQDPRRVRAMILAVDNDVFLCASREIAELDAGSTTASDGFYLPKGIVMPYTGQSALWVAATTTASTSRVSVLAETE